jgi:DNA-directed RNA polymerase subunit K/omega
MTQEHPITPPPELVEQWMQVHTTKYDLARQAAQWGADQELDACCELLNDFNTYHLVELLRAARIRKPPSLKEQALAALNEIEDRHAGPTIQEELIRRALEQLPDHE